MGRSARTDAHKIKPRSQTLPSSPTHSSSSSDFEFTVSLSPRKSTTSLIPADELFYEGQLLPLHLSPRLSMVRNLLSSSSTSSSDTTTTASRDSTGSSSTSSSSDHLLLLPDSRHSCRRPSSVTGDDSHTFSRPLNFNFTTNHHHLPPHTKKPKYFSLSRFSSVFRKEPKLNNNHQSDHTNLGSGSSAKRVSLTAKDVIRKYLKKVKPLYEKLSQKQGTTTSSRASTILTTTNSSQIARSKENTRSKDNNGGTISHSFSGNLRYPRRKSCVSSCPSSMRSSPSHSGVLSRNGVTLMSKQFGMGTSGGSSSSYNSESSSMEELQSAIQGAIAHCKNSMNIQTATTTNTTTNNNKTSALMVSNEV